MEIYTGRIIILQLQPGKGGFSSSHQGRFSDIINTMDDITKIDVDNLFLEQLIQLHNKIVLRIWQLQQASYSDKLQEFQIGEKVRFQSEQGETVAGIIIRVNKKSLTVRTDTGNKWYVHPWAVTKVVDV